MITFTLQKYLVSKDLGRWTASWISPFVDFGWFVFSIPKVVYNSNTKFQNNYEIGDG